MGRFTWKHSGLGSHRKLAATAEVFLVARLRNIRVKRERLKKNV